MAGAVRELVTKIKFVVDRASISAANTATNNLKASLARASASARSASSGFSRFFSDFRSGFKTGFATEFDRLAQSSERASRNISKVGASASGAFSTLRSLAGAMAAYVSVSAIKATADEMMNLDGRLRTVTASDEERYEVEKKLYDLSQRSRQNTSTTGDLFFRMIRSGRRFGLSADEALRATETVAKALVVGGASTTEAQSGVMQLGQALASGRLQGEEYRSVSENMSIIKDYIASYLNVTDAELREMSSRGELTTEVVLTAIKAAAGAVDAEFEKMPITIGQSLEMVGNGFNYFVLRLEQRTGVFSGIAKTIVKSFNKASVAVDEFSKKYGGLFGRKKNDKQTSSVSAVTNQEASPWVSKAIRYWETLKYKILEVKGTLDYFFTSHEEQFGRIEESYLKLFGALETLAGMIDGFLTPLFEPLLELAATVMEVLSGVYASFFSGFSEQMEQYGPLWEQIMLKFRASINNVTEALKIMKPYIEIIADLVGRVLAGMFTAFADAASAALELVTGLLKGLAEMADYAIRRTKEAVTGQKDAQLQAMAHGNGGGGGSFYSSNQEFTVNVNSAEEAAAYTNEVSGSGFPADVGE